MPQKQTKGAQGQPAAPPKVETPAPAVTSTSIPAATLAAMSLAFSAIVARMASFVEEALGMPLNVDYRVLASLPPTRATKVSDVRYYEVIHPTQILPKNVDPTSFGATRDADGKLHLESINENIEQVELEPGVTRFQRETNAEGAGYILISPMSPEPWDVAKAGVVGLLELHAGGRNNTFQTNAKNLGLAPGQKLDANGNPRTNAKGEVVPARWTNDPIFSNALTDKIVNILADEKLTIPPPLDIHTFARIVSRAQTRGTAFCPTDACETRYAISEDAWKRQTGATCAQHSQPLTWEPPKSQAEVETEVAAEVGKSAA